MLQSLFARFRNPQQLVTVFSPRIILAHFARINSGAKRSITPFISTANPRCVGKFPSLPLYKNEYVRLVLEDVGRQPKLSSIAKETWLRRAALFHSRRTGGDLMGSAAGLLSRAWGFAARNRWTAALGTAVFA